MTSLRDGDDEEPRVKKEAVRRLETSKQTRRFREMFWAIDI